MRSRGYWLFLVVLLAGCTRGGPGEPVYIGHLAPLQSTDKLRFEHTRQGMSLAIEEFDRQRGSTPTRRVVVLHVNTEEDLVQLQASAVRLLTVNRAVALIGGHDAAQVESLTRASQPYEAPLITSIMTTPNIATDTLYSLEPSPARSAKMVARWLKEVVKKESVALVFDSRSSVASELGTALRVPGQGTEAVNFVDVPFGTAPKIAEIAETIRQSKTTACLFLGRKAADLLELRRALHNAKLKLPCLVFDGVGPIEALTTIVEPDEPLYQLTTYFLQESDKATNAFQAAYSKRFHADPDIFAAQGYDAVRMIAEGTTSGKINGAGRLAVDLAAFSKNSFASSTGPLSFEPTTHTANRVLFLIQKTDKKSNLVFKLEPEVN